MSPRRGERAAPPPGRDQWDVRFASNDAAKGWEELCRRAPGTMNAAWQTMRANPIPRVATDRHHRLKYSLATGAIRGRSCAHWQIEVTGAGRIWYLADIEAHTVCIDYAGPAHPKTTDWTIQQHLA
jgi:hypothetical protein